MKPYQVTVVHDHASILAASHIVMSPGLRPRRVVMRQLSASPDSGELTVCREYLTAMIVKERRGDHDYEAITFEHDSFDNGSYFCYSEQLNMPFKQAREKAQVSFDERSKRCL